MAIAIWSGFDGAQRGAVVHAETALQAIPTSINNHLWSRSGLVVQDPPEALVGHKGIRLVQESICHTPLLDSLPIAQAEIVLEDGSASPMCTRSLLQRVVETWRTSGIDITCGVEIEFHADTHSDGPDDGSGSYSLPSTLQCLDLICHLSEVCQDIGLQVEKIHKEDGTGQFELSTAPMDPLSAADGISTLLALMPIIATHQGVNLSFHPVPRNATKTNGMHLNVGFVEMNEDSDIKFESWLTSLIANGPAVRILTVPTVDSCARLIRGSASGAGQFYSASDRNAMVRLPPRRLSLGQNSNQLEYRSADCLASPHAAVGAVLAGLLADPGIDVTPLVEFGEPKAQFEHHAKSFKNALPVRSILGEQSSVIVDLLAEIELARSTQQAFNAPAERGLHEPNDDQVT